MAVLLVAPQTGRAAAAQGGAPATAAAASVTAVPAGGHRLTLLTGDTVVVASPRATTATVRAAKGREHLRFLTYRAGGDLYVVPQDAMPLIRDGKVDRRLFDVTELIRFGYDDAHRASLPLIMSYRHGAARPDATMSGAGIRVTHDLPDVAGVAAVVSKANAVAVWSSVTTGTDAARTDTTAGVGRIWLDGKRAVALDESVPQIGAPAAWQAGFTGKGVAVAVLDTGVDTTHPDLMGKVLAQQDFTGTDVSDSVGHGTHVASTIAGTGAASGGRYKGVAPDATLLSGKVCTDQDCPESAILAGMQWAAVTQHAKVVNMSLGGRDTPDLDPVEQAVNSLTTEYGTLFVVAAGNIRPQDDAISSPGTADAALTVGAVDKSDNLAAFSRQGPRPGDDAVKPDITAPGIDIVAARAAGVEDLDPVGDAYTRMSGTSMATPHVAGSAAILAQQHPDWSAAQFKAALMASAHPNPSIGAFAQGAGRLDVARAITQQVTSEPASLSYGRQAWPHTDDTPVTRTVNYHNSGATDVPLDLAVKVVGPDPATPPPAGLVALSANHVMVPAGGTASVDVTMDTRVGSADGLYSGQLLATGAQVQVSTPLGFNKEIEYHNLTINYRNRNGTLSQPVFAVLTSVDDPMRAVVPVARDSGTVTVRVPSGTYDLFAFIDTAGPGDASQFTLLVQPVLSVTADLTVEMDARTAKPVTSTVPSGEARVAGVEFGYLHKQQNGDTLSAATIQADSFDGLFSGQQGPSLPSDLLTGHVDSTWAKPNADGGFDNSPYVYAVSETTPGAPNGYTRHYQNQDLAVVRTKLSATVPDEMALLQTSAHNNVSAPLLGLMEPPGSTVTQFLSAVGGQEWDTTAYFGSLGPDGFSSGEVLSDVSRYQAGSHYDSLWNQAPFGPVFPVPPTYGEFISRTGDLLFIEPPVFGDASGHAGFTVLDTATIRLFRDGTLIGQSSDSFAQFPVPPDAASYRVEVTQTRSGFDGLSSQVNVAWSFTSRHVPPDPEVFGDTYLTQPVMAVRFTPELDKANQAPAGTFEIPVSVQAQQGSTATEPQLRTVEASYDDGASWHPAAIRRTRTGWVAVVNQPATGFVSLRASATDAAGDRVDQTIVHAYGLTTR